MQKLITYILIERCQKVFVLSFFSLKKKVKSEVNPVMELLPPEGMENYGQSASSLEYEVHKEKSSHQA